MKAVNRHKLNSALAVVFSAMGEQLVAESHDAATCEKARVRFEVALRGILDATQYVDCFEAAPLQGRLRLVSK